MFAGMWLVIGTGPVDTARSFAKHEAVAAYIAAPGAPVPTSPIPVESLTEVVQRYCVVCHNDALMTGNQTFQDFSVENADERPETAEKMIRKLRMGMMPPPGIPRPGGDTLQALVEALESTVDAAARVAPNLGDRRFQRLTRAEYERVVFDLLDLEVNAGSWFPEEMLLGGFDNASAAQGLTTTLLDSYLRAASEVSRLAIGDAEAPSSSIKYRNPAEVSQHAWDHIEGTPFGTRGGMVVTHDFPADGEYVFQVEHALGDKQVPEDVDISIDGEPAAIIMMVRRGGDRRRGQGGSLIGPVRTEPVFVRAGQHQVSAAFVNRIDGVYEDRFQPTEWSYAGTRGGQAGTTGLTHLTELLITGPDNVTGVSENASRERVFTCRPTSATQERPCAETILTKLATQAYRRPVAAEDVTDLMMFYDEAAAEGGFELGVRAGLQAILVSPEFVFRFEREPTNVRPGQSYPLSDVDFVTRLSFFLWASAPDEELLEVARSGRLSDPAVLEHQVGRMLQDQRSEALSTRFFGQWLRLQDVGKVWPESSLFPGFSQQLAEGMVKETELLFQHIIREDRSMLDIFDADYTFINDRLAQYYGIEGISGEAFRRVQYPPDQRRGILGHGSVLQLTSMSDRTSPVLRGKWVMEVLMGTPPPPPPPNVPAFEASPDASGGRRLTTRQRMEAHSAAPVCASCHDFIDPIGLALDNFDATGKLRTRENMMPLDTRGTFYDGTPIASVGELADVLLKRPIPLARNFADRFLAYAVGRPTEYFDQPTVRAIAQAAEMNDYKISSFIMGVVTSDMFRMRQVRTTAN
jgi:hypothetical protein